MIKEKTNLGNFVLCKRKQICQWAITSLLYLSLLFLSFHLYARAQYISWELWLKRSNNKSYQYRYGSKNLTCQLLWQIMIVTLVKEKWLYAFPKCISVKGTNMKRIRFVDGVAAINANKLHFLNVDRKSCIICVVKKVAWILEANIS